MSSSTRNSFLLPSPAAQKVFFDVFDGQACQAELEAAALYLCEQLDEAEQLDSDLPRDTSELHSWMQNGVEKVGQDYRRYLDERQAGSARRYFRNKSHALYFLKSVAPTKMVDGAWLYGLLHHWQDARFSALIQTYLEELGEGLPSKNHVVLYKKLLASQGCQRWDDLSDEHYVQGAIQLALAYHADRFLPEIIGFNLGYEQLPLHLLITAYELKELGIDPYYFTLHITVDNADSGHAKKAVDSVLDAMPRVGNRADFYRRVCNGYKLNFLGADTHSVIEEFDLAEEMIAIFSRKGAIGRYAHSDYRQVEGRTVNQWLSVPNETGALLRAMESEGWFKRHQDPQNSRFWKLIQSEKAKMFGVFSAYEQQVIYDWIAGDWADGTMTKPPVFSFEARRRLTESAADNATSGDDFDCEVRALEAEIAASSDQQESMSKLIALMSPANHYTAPGLVATRIFNDLFG